jgi:hypothetical protein
MRRPSKAAADPANVEVSACVDVSSACPRACEGESLLVNSAYCTKAVNTDRSQGIVSGCH